MMKTGQLEEDVRNLIDQDEKNQEAIKKVIDENNQLKKLLADHKQECDKLQNDLRFL